MNAGRRMVVLAALAVAVQAARGVAAESEPYYKACYLQSEERDFAAAAELFAQAARDEDAPPELRVAAERRLAGCREELAAADLAGLMPADSIAYVQFANIGAQAKTLLETLGLAGQPPTSAASGQRIPIERGLSLPVDFALSPALVREIAKLGGVAAALTGFDERGLPQGVVVVHLGDTDLVRGLVETGLQVVTPEESIEGYRTFQIPADDMTLWMIETERLLVLSPSRDQVGAVAARLKQPGAGESLKDARSFRAVGDARENSRLFAWADSERAAPLVYAAMQRDMAPQEFAAASAVLNLPQIDCATFALGAVEGGLRAEAAVRLKPEGQHLLYSLLRTAPIGADALRHVPREAAITAAIGLNPPASSEPTEKGATAPLALMDLGRELFANMRSATVFVTPGGGPLPEVGVVVLARDAAKSHELWTQLMGLPARLGAMPADAASETQLAGRKAMRYQYPDAPPIFVSQPSDDALVIGTAAAVENALAAADSSGDGAEGSLLERANEATSKALFVQFGPLVRFAAGHASGAERDRLTALAPVLDEATASLMIDEHPSELRIRLEVAGVPRVSDVLRSFGAAQSPGEQQAAR
jgi:hypothetical protein